MSEQYKPQESNQISELPLTLPKVGIIGLAKSGKGYAGEILEKEFGFASFAPSDVIRDYASRNGIPLSKREDFWAVRSLLEQQFGKTYLFTRSMELMADLYNSSPESVKGIVLAGIRTPWFTEAFIRLPNSLLIGITAPPEVRYQRRIIGRPEDNVTFEEFVEYEQNEVDIVNQSLSLAPKIINNEGSMEEFAQQIRNAVTSKFYS